MKLIHMRLLWGHSRRVMIECLKICSSLGPQNSGQMKLVVMAKEMLGLYSQHPHKKIKGTEVPFAIPLINPADGRRLEVNLEGIFDLIEADDTIVESYYVRQRRYRVL